jgi:hypothetical protein
VPLGPRIKSLHVLFGSKVVRMGVSMANLKLGGIILFNSREAFEQALRQASESKPGTFKPRTREEGYSASPPRP